ncbi:MAG: TRAP transporter large permease subunit, partial [Alphaproteobacteria bacterium]|nr:TRAP transporter large permease subunit [Alphaproteobacteria bacterium]
PDKAPLAADHTEANLKDVIQALIDILPPAALILMVLGSIFMGIATVTEASGVGALGATLIAAFYKNLSWKVLKDVVVNTMN